MNDTDLTAALHRDADLVGEPAPDLLDQLRRRRQHQSRQRAGLLAATLGVVVIAAGIPLGGALMNNSDGGPATDPTPSVTTEVTPATPAATDVQVAPTTVEAPAPSTPVVAPDAPCPDDAEIMAALPPLDGGDHFDLTGSRAPLCSDGWAATFPALVLSGAAVSDSEIVPTLLKDVDGVWTWDYPDQLCRDGGLPDAIDTAVCDYY